MTWPAGQPGVIAREVTGQPGEAGQSGVRDLLLRLAGGLLAVVGGFATGALMVLLVPLRVGDVAWSSGPLAANSFRLPVAVLVAVGGGLFLVGFARRATELRWGPVLPAVGWFAMVVLALRTTAEGDRLLAPDDWVGTLALFGGTLVLVIGVVLGFTSPRPPAGPGSAGPASVGPAEPPRPTATN